MNSYINKANEFIINNKNKILDSFVDFLTIPSISSDPEHRLDISRAAEWIRAYLENVGISNTEILETAKHPVVFGEYDCGDTEKPTVLIYGHYDVQPPDPLEFWESAPFTPVIKDNLIFARGSSDMKGQLMVLMSAIQAITQTGSLSLNLKFMIEGEEEIGSPSIETFLEENKKRFASDFVLNLDAGMLSKSQPSIVYGLRGLGYFEIHVKGPSHDLHSGLFGGVVKNPINALTDIISGLKDNNGVIQLPGFYDDVLPIDPEEKAQMSRLGLNEDYYKKQTGARKLFGEKGYTPTERIGARPTLDVNGIVGGFTGIGPKTVIPSTAMAKISMRLVPNQTPRKVYEQLQAYMEQNAPQQIEWEIKRLSGDSETPYVTDPFLDETKYFAQSLKKVWGVEPVYHREGGSIPIASNIQNVLGISSILSGFGLPGDKIHSPNERMNLEVFWKGIEAVIHYFINLGENNK